MRLQSTVYAQHRENIIYKASFLPIAEQEKLSYYDTQVIPHTDYFYKIFAHKAVLGTEYKVVPNTPEEPIVWHKSIANFPTSKWHNEERWFAQLKYEIEPFIQFIRVPYYNAEAVNLKVDKLNYSRIEDKSSISHPKLIFVPFRNINNKILILLNNSIGRVEQYPRIVFRDEWVIFDQMQL